MLNDNRCVFPQILRKPATNWTNWTHLCLSYNPAWTAYRPMSLLLEMTSIRLYPRQTALAVTNCCQSCRNSIHWTPPSLWVQTLLNLLMLSTWIYALHDSSIRQIRWGLWNILSKLWGFMQKMYWVIDWVLRLQTCKTRVKDWRGSFRNNDLCLQPPSDAGWDSVTHYNRSSSLALSGQLMCSPPICTSLFLHSSDSDTCTLSSSFPHQIWNGSSRNIQSASQNVEIPIMLFWLSTCFLSACYYENCYTAPCRPRLFVLSITQDYIYLLVTLLTRVWVCFFSTDAQPERAGVSFGWSREN